MGQKDPAPGGTGNEDVAADGEPADVAEVEPDVEAPVVDALPET